MRAFMATEAGSAGLLLTSTAVVLIWANPPLSESYESLPPNVLLLSAA